jgi:hypothetical protein
MATGKIVDQRIGPFPGNSRVAGQIEGRIKERVRSQSLLSANLQEVNQRVNACRGHGRVLPEVETNVEQQVWSKSLRRAALQPVKQGVFAGTAMFLAKLRREEYVWTPAFSGTPNQIVLKRGKHRPLHIRVMRDVVFAVKQAALDGDFPRVSKLCGKAQPC